MNHQKILIVLLGPTAVGKTSLAIQVAADFEAEIISADSRQFFKEMSIGTAKPSDSELKKVKHHFINSHSVKNDYNVGEYEQEAVSLLEKLYRKKDAAVLVGGSGLYINAVCKGLDHLPKADEKLRNDLADIYKTKGIAAIRILLKKLDPKHYKSVDLSNPHRLMRALEVCLIAGKPYSALRSGKQTERNFAVIKIGLNTDREKLYERINERVDKMIETGLLDETKSLLKFRDKIALKTVGYKELFEHLDGKTDLQTAVERIKKNTRNYAKRQLTWFRRDNDITWFEPHQYSEIIKYIQSVINK